MDAANKPTAEASTPTADSTGSPPELAARLVSVEAALKLATEKAEAERKLRIERQVHDLACDHVFDAPTWLPRAIADEGILADLAKLPRRTTDPAPRSYAYGDEGPLDRVRKIATAKGRFEFMRDNWDDLRMAEASFKKRGAPMGANTTSSIATSILGDGVVTILQNKLAALALFSRNFGIDPMASRDPVVFKWVSAGGTAQSNATNFEDTTNFVGTIGPKTYTPAQLTAGGHITNAELNSGFLMADWAEIKGQEIAEKIMSVVTALILVGTYTGTPLTAAAAAFGVSDLKTLWGQLKKARRKHLILDGGHFAQLLPATLEDFNVLTMGLPGWDAVAQNDYWTGATANTVGFACDPQALGVGAGLPQTPPSAGVSGLRQSVFTVPGVGISVQVNEWFSLASRTDWTTYDVVFGAVALDATAGIIIKSA